MAPRTARPTITAGTGNPHIIELRRDPASANLNVQSRLSELGFLKKSRRSGVYDSHSVKAMKKFQEAHGTSSNGIPNHETMGLLFPSRLF